MMIGIGLLSRAVTIICLCTFERVIDSLVSAVLLLAGIGRVLLIVIIFNVCNL